MLISGLAGLCLIAVNVSCIQGDRSASDLIAHCIWCATDSLGQAACEACKMLKTTFGPVDQKLNRNHIADEKPQIESPGFLQEAYGEVDVHVQVDEDMVFDDFNEEEADGND